ncbi:MAG TPA: hypothetical protein VJA66_17580 [Thermoanaerobaculia bacterium]
MKKRLLGEIGGCLLLAAAAVSCSSSSTPKSVAPPIPTEGENRSLEALVGRWDGNYNNPVNGRTGSIVLEVFSGGKEAHGDILMVPPEAQVKIPSPEETIRTMPQVLEINFIQAAGNEISGTVGPYEDPESHCRAHSTFTGAINGSVIKGTFRTECIDSEGRPTNEPFTSGTWLVTRTK